MAGDQANLVAEPEPGHPAWPVIAVIGPRTVRVSLTIPRVYKSRINYFDLFRLADVYPMWQHHINDARDLVDVGFHL